MGLARALEAGEYAFGHGRIVVYGQLPARICLKREYADAWRALVKDTLAKGGVGWQWRNDITLRRGPYVICEVMDESVTAEPKVFEGCYADLMENGFPIISRKVVHPDGGALLYDLNSTRPNQFTIIGTAARLSDARVSEEGVSFRAKAANLVLTHIRVRLPFPLEKVTATDENGAAVALDCDYDETTGTALFIYRSEDKAVNISGVRRRL